MIKNEIKIFPFEFISMGKEKCPFIQNVESILLTNLQSNDSFGCKIKNCHTHAGSKVHFEDFIEAELLFHNNYYNHGFAFLSVEKIINEINAKKEINRVILIGYESYSELYLQEVQSLIKQYNVNIKCDYCVYETIAKNEKGERITMSQVRNLTVVDDNIFVQYGYLNNDEDAIEINKTLFVFIVPINTTLSTMDKMISLFKKKIKNCPTLNTLLLCLITIGSNDKHNHYWEAIFDSQNIITGLRPKNERFVELSSKNTVSTLAYVQSNWSYAKVINRTSEHLNYPICKHCYPDMENNINNNVDNLLNEKPIFDVTRGSVVPMLQLGTTEYLKPTAPFECNPKDKNNLERLWKLSNNMAYKHIARGENHFQFYFDAMGFLNQYDKNVREYLQNIRKNFNKTVDDSVVVYNYIVAPRQETNSKWVNLVYSNIFVNNVDHSNLEYHGSRILYFDVTKEYRSNLKAKYSDFFRSIDNIAHSGQNFELRFHYVDETIASGDTFLRAADLIRSLLTTINISSDKIKNANIAIFHSIFLLYGRSSSDSKEFYNSLFKKLNFSIEDRNKIKDNFHEYVHINISQMRNYEDACILCKLVNNYRRIQKYCGTNELAAICYDFIENHKVLELPTDMESFSSSEYTKDKKDTFHCSMEKRFVFFITHILNNRLSHNNGPLFLEKNNKDEILTRGSEKIVLPIDVESENADKYILQILDDYYLNLFDLLLKYDVFNLINDFKNESHNCKLCNNTDCSNCESFSDYQKRFKDKYQEDFNNAFIKAISRPFFIFHLRKRQASFEFCLNKLHAILSIKPSKKGEQKVIVLRLMQSLVKALTDMNANYLIRSTDIFSPFEKLLEWAKLGDTYSSENSKKIFNSKSFRNYLKKMMSLTQDTTKSLLLEHILINKTEHGFFNGFLDNNYSTKDFLENNQITEKGLIYLENNRIIKDALNDILYTNNATESLPYYFDNFKNICRANSFNISDSIEAFGKSYKEVHDFLSGFATDSSLNSKINTWLNIINKEMSVISFVRDITNKNNHKDPNHLFDFFLISDEISADERTSFYHDDHISKLMTLLNLDEKDESDIIFFENFVWIKFRANENSKDCIFLEIKNFKRENILCWFALKVLLTLRNDFVSYIARINLPAVIKARAEEMRKKALILNKSITHSAAETFMNPDIYLKNIDEPWKSYCENLNGKKAQVPYDKYFQIVANEMISHMYRKIVRCEKEILYNINSDKNKRPITEIQNVFKNTFVKNNDGKYIIHCFYDDGSIKPIELDFEFLSDEQAKNLFVSDFMVFHGEMDPLILLTLIMVMNVAEHGTGEKLQICFEEYGLTFNSAYSNSIQEDKISEYINIPPWHFDDPHITLWSLKHFLNDKFTHKIHPKNKTFTTSFHIFSKHGNNI